MKILINVVLQKVTLLPNITFANYKILENPCFLLLTFPLTNQIEVRTI